MNAKKERELFLAVLERLLDKERRMVEEYRTLAELVKSVPIALLLDWVVVEEEAHFTLLCNIITSLKRIPSKKGNGADCVGLEQRNALGWVQRLRLKEQALAGDCHSLKSQACWEDRELIDALLDALVMDSEKHQRFLLTVEKVVKNMKTSRLQ
jgi:hypothetical protein